MKVILMSCVFAALAGSAAAGPILWTVSGTFNDGGTLNGTFSYDADTNGYAAVNLVTTAGSSITSGSTYNFVCGAPCTGVTPTGGAFLALTQLSANNLTGTPALSIFPNVPLTNAGGTFNSLYSLEGSCNNSTCGGPAVPIRSFANGIISSETQTPEPSTFLLISAGAGLMWARRRFAKGAGAR